MQWGVPVMHPAYTFRQVMALGPLQAHVANFVRRLVKGFSKDPLLLASPHVSKLEWLISECKRRNIALAVDVEAMPPLKGPKEWAAMPNVARLRAVGVGAAFRTTVGEREYDGVGMSWFFPMDRACWAAFNRAMLDPKLKKVFCNGWSYDIPLMARYGVKVKGVIHDIRDGRRALVSTARVGLGPQAAIYLTCGPWKAEALESEDDMKGFVDAARIDRRKLLRYNAEDCVRTAQIRTKQVYEFTKEEPEDSPRRVRLYRQQLRLARVGASMHIKGFPVDHRRRLALSRILTDLAFERAQHLATLLKPYCKVKILKDDEDASKWKGYFRISYRGGVNENDLRALLFRQCAVPGIRSFELEVPMSEKSWTEGGTPAVNKKALIVLWSQDNTPSEVKAIIRGCWHADSPLKARSTFIDSDVVLAAIGPDGRIHPKHNTCGAETGRWSCSEPNLYNLSEKKDDDSTQGELPNMRDIYIAPPGYVIVHRDYKQLELEVMADYTDDQTLRRMLSTGDAHTARVHEWFGIPYGQDVPKNLRKQGKVVGFNSQYSGGVESVALSVWEQMPDVPFDTIAILHAEFPNKHPGIAAHWERSLDFANTHGYNETAIMHRRRYYPPGVHLLPTETSNYAIQGTAADIANGTMVGIEESDYKSSMVATLEKHWPSAWLAMHTYDSFDIICREKDAKDIDQMLDEKMAGPSDGWKIGDKPRHLKSDGKIGKRWSEV